VAVAARIGRATPKMIARAAATQRSPQKRDGRQGQQPHIVVDRGARVRHLFALGAAEIHIGQRRGDSGVEELFALATIKLEHLLDFLMRGLFDDLRVARLELGPCRREGLHVLRVESALGDQRLIGDEGLVGVGLTLLEHSHVVCCLNIAMSFAKSLVCCATTPVTRRASLIRESSSLAVSIPSWTAEGSQSSRTSAAMLLIAAECDRPNTPNPSVFTNTSANAAITFVETDRSRQNCIRRFPLIRSGAPTA
jgi:hypothetical protein